MDVEELVSKISIARILTDKDLIILQARDGISMVRYKELEKGVRRYNRDAVDLPLILLLPNIVEVVRIEGKAYCVDPTAIVVPCSQCGSDVYTCERDPPDESGGSLDWTCPVHPDGSELGDGRWVCSLSCWEILVSEGDSDAAKSD